MLAFDDASFARLLRAARDVPHGQRRKWLRSIADEHERCMMVDK